MKLVDAYLASTYAFSHAGKQVAMKVGIRSEELAALHQARGVESSTLITAWNPRSEPAGAQENEQRNAALLAELDALGLEWLPAEGRDGDWKEAGFLVLGISLAAARDLALKYEQNAILFATGAATPQLVLTGIAAPR